MKEIIFIILLAFFVLTINSVTFSEDISGNCFNMTFTGDILLDPAYLPDKKYPFLYVEKILRESDISVGNLECPISYVGSPNPAKSTESIKSGRNYVFRGSPELAKSLQNAGYDVFSLANNHSMDYGDRALIDTLNYLKEMGIGWAGAGKNKREAKDPFYIEVKGTKVAFLAYSEIVPSGYEATEYHPGIAVARMDYYGATFDEDIKSAKKKCDILVVFFHWGVENTFYADYIQSNYARRAIDMGADIVIGSHPHVLQGVEEYKNGIIAYSLGNFVFDPRGEDAKETIIFQCFFEDKKLVNIKLIPVYIKSGKPQIAEGERNKKILNRMIKLSKKFGTVVEIRDDYGIIKIDEIF
jgi:poly-gamma-glutamate synthesis protein (capsule biosynthesis protein)